MYKSIISSQQWHGLMDCVV
uniref:Uncharacterized protein n=1 Tax=Anguilla anguilla TaxID=7936 RepID=A0A0E9V8V9_ANGAN